MPTTSPSNDDGRDATSNSTEKVKTESSSTTTTTDTTIVDSFGKNDQSMMDESFYVDGHLDGRGGGSASASSDDKRDDHPAPSDTHTGMDESMGENMEASSPMKKDPRSNSNDQYDSMAMNSDTLSSHTNDESQDTTELQKSGTNDSPMKHVSSTDILPVKRRHDDTAAASHLSPLRTNQSFEVSLLLTLSFTSGNQRITVACAIFHYSNPCFTCSFLLMNSG